MNNISRVLLTNALYDTNKLKYNKTRSNDDSFNQLLQNSITKLGNISSGCSCNNDGISSLGALLTLTGIINQNNINLNIDNQLNNNNQTIDNINNNLSINNNSAKLEPNMSKAIDLLKDQLGKPYVWGANGPESFDCSGLVRYIYKNALGKDIPRVSYEQSEFGQFVDREDLQVGDLLFFDTMNKGRVSHVGMYIGNNEFIHASNPKTGVIKSTLSGYYEKKYINARRP